MVNLDIVVVHSGWHVIFKSLPCFSSLIRLLQYWRGCTLYVSKRRLTGEKSDRMILCIKYILWCNQTLTSLSLYPGWPYLICQLFNKWYVEGVPKELKECWSLLLHKGDDREEVNNYRPLTMGSILIRLYAKIWDKRMRKFVFINPRRKAFVPLDGCF